MEAMPLEEDEVLPIIHVPDVRPISHFIARRIEKSMTKSRTDGQGFLHSRKGRIVPIKLTAGALPRALRIIDALFAALDDAKLMIEWPSPNNTALKIVADGEKLQFMIMETIERKERKPTSEELARQGVGTSWRPRQGL
jgi:hypothetical protein